MKPGPCRTRSSSLFRASVHSIGNSRVDGFSRLLFVIDPFCLAQKIVRQRRHITNGQFTNLAAADSLSFYDRSIAIFENQSGVNQKRLAGRGESHPFRRLSNKSIPSSPSRSWICLLNGG